MFLLFNAFSTWENFLPFTVSFQHCFSFEKLLTGQQINIHSRLQLELEMRGKKQTNMNYSFYSWNKNPLYNDPGCIVNGSTLAQVRHCCCDYCCWNGDNVETTNRGAREKWCRTEQGYGIFKKINKYSLVHKIFISEISFLGSSATRIISYTTFHISRSIFGRLTRFSLWHPSNWLGQWAHRINF